MTWALEASVKQAAFPATPGISARAKRLILASMARIAQSDGTFRYGLRGSKIAELSDHSLSVVRRFERWAVKEGILERVEIGGGRKATKWRIVIEKLMSFLPHKTPQETPPDTSPKPPRHSPRPRTGWTRGLFSGGGTHPRRQTLGSILTGEHTEVFTVCIHGGDGGMQPTTGLPRCPGCRSTA